MGALVLGTDPLLSGGIGLDELLVVALKVLVAFGGLLFLLSSGFSLIFGLMRRPSLPDSLPMIGRSARQPGVFYAFGHGHLGLTQSAATGRLIRDLVLGQVPAIDLQPFSPQRF